MKTIVYVDGFNLYYGCVKDAPYKWLNILRMSELLLPRDQIVGVKYFTAKVFSRKDDPQKHIRQQVYWRALCTIPNPEIIEGHYSVYPKWVRVAHPSKDLHDEALFLKQIRQGVITASQFPPIMSDEKGSFHKPEDW